MTPSEIMEFYDNNPNLTLKELSRITGRSIAYLKGLLLA
jgi:hypothetical protein